VICVVAGLAVGAENIDGAYSGKRTLTKGSGPMCPGEENVSATIHGETLSFSNSAHQNVGMGFYPHPDGSFHQTYADKGGAAVDIRGRIIGDVIEADVTNPPCEHHWHLKKQ
jgi:hypothetical protein